jgi:hypothetical protein
MNVPYTTTTGVKIGSRYRENGNTIPISDPDMLFLQEALLSTPQYRKAKHIEILTMRISIALFLIIAFYGLLFR